MNQFTLPFTSFRILSFVSILCIIASQVSACRCSCHPFLAASLPSPSTNVAEFCEFCRLHSKAYTSAKEALQRLDIYINNSKLVEQLNARSTGVRFSTLHSPFADITPIQFATNVLNSKSIFTPNHQHPKSIAVKVNQNVHVSRRKMSSDTRIDWTDKGVVSSVKNQGSLGTCWAFSAIGAVESQVAIHTGKLVDLSVEQLVECDNSRDTIARDADCAEFGGWPFLAFEFMKRFGGVYKDERFPYCAGMIDRKTRLPKCFPCMPRSYDRLYCGNHSDLYCNASSTKGQGRDGFCKRIAPEDVAARVTGHRSLAKDEEVIAEELKEHGPVSVALNAMPLQFYRSGVVDPYLCNPKDLNHAVLLVGYGQDLHSGKKFWKVKNSWGVKFGEHGYFRIRRGVGKCGIDRAAAIPTVA